MANADRLIELFNEAKARPAGVERERFLAEACRDSPELKEQVISLLQAHEAVGDFLKITIASPTIFVPPDPSELAKHFPQLEIIGLIGQGGMGVVYKARHRQLERMVALKILLPEPGRDSSFAERFIREARALARLNHPNIVSVYDFGQSEGLYYFLMEFVDGVNLRQLEQSRRLTPPEALTIIPKICEALQYAHDEGIVHRDIKPGNILVDKRGRVKIADFGLAKLLGKQATDFALTGSQQVMGTPHYMAPEQMEKPQTVDHRADIYSLGVVFYEMLTGELPIGRFALPSHKVQMDVRLDEVVLKSLEKEPDRRYQHASEVKRDVESIDSSTSGSAPSGTVDSPTIGESAAKAVVQQARAAAIGLSATGPASKQEPTEGKTLAETTLEKSEAESSALKPKPPVYHPILVSIVAAVLLLAVGSYLAISHLAGEKSGSIEITSAPTGAEVSLNGQKVGTTPYRDSKIVPGEVSYLLKVEAHNDYRNTTNITAKTKAKLHIVLSRQTGTVVLTSDPSGAEILTNGVVIGKTPSTNILLTGRHRFTLRYPNLKEQKLTVRVENKQTKKEVVEFPRGEIQIRSEPSGATVLISGRPIGQTPTNLVFSPGKVSFELQLPGYNSATVKTNVLAKAKLEMAVTLSEGQGTIALGSDPAGAEIYWNDKPQDTTPARLTLPRGRQELILRYGHLLEQTKTVEVEKDKEKSAFVVFPRANLMLESNPSGAEVLMGTNVFGITPTNLLVNPGNIELELKINDFSGTVKTNLADGATVAVRVPLSVGRGRVYVVSDPPGASIFSTDGKRLGSAGSSIELPKGVHGLVARHPFYTNLEEQMFSVIVQKDAIRTNEVKFRYGSLVIRSKPDGAAIFQDEKQIGTTPHTILFVKPGPVEYELRLEEYLTEVVSTNIVEGKTAMVVNRELTRGTGIIAFTSEPLGAQILVKDSLLGTTPLTTNLLTGTHLVKARYGDQPEQTTTLVLKLGEEKKVRFGFELPTTGPMTMTNSIGMILVEVRDNLWVGQSKVTTSEYQRILPGGTPAVRGSGQSVKVTWTDAITFCGQLTAREQALKKLGLKNDLIYSLPKTDEWTEVAQAQAVARALAAEPVRPIPGDDASEWCFTNKGLQAPTIIVTNPGTGELRLGTGKELDMDSEKRTFRCVLAPRRGYR